MEAKETKYIFHITITWITDQTTNTIKRRIQTFVNIDEFLPTSTQFRRRFEWQCLAKWSRAFHRNEPNTLHHYGIVQRTKFIFVSILAFNEKYARQMKWNVQWIKPEIFIGFKKPTKFGDRNSCDVFIQAINFDVNDWFYFIRANKNKTEPRKQSRAQTKKTRKYIFIDSAFVTNEPSSFLWIPNYRYTFHTNREWHLFSF